MRNVIGRVWLGVVLILLVSSVLLVSDWRQRSAGRGKVPRIAIFQYASRPIMDDGVGGAMEALAARGYIDGKTLQITRYNAENDLPTANNIARTIVDGGYDMVITASTPCMQAMAAANITGKVQHVFGLVTDPFASGVGLKPGHPLDHPRHFVGVGTFQPVREVLLTARKMNPNIRRVGTVWNPAEACSEACIRVARKTAAELGFELLETHVDNSAGVSEAAKSMVSRGVDAMFVGGDNTVEVAIKSLIRAAEEARVPVITCAPANVEDGASVSMGADYVEVGRIMGHMAADLLEGADPAKIAITDRMPRKLGINMVAMGRSRAGWQVPEEVRAAAALGVNADGSRWRKDDRPATKKWNVHLVELVNAPSIDETRQGILTGLKESGLVEGRDYTIHVANAQGDLPTLSNMIDAALTARADMVYTITTPALQVAMRKVKDRPVLFALALDPLLVGDPGSHESHLPNVAGVYDRSPFEGMVKLIRECMPKARSIGTLYAPSEANSVRFREELEKAARAGGLKTVAVASNSAGEAADAALALTSRGIDAVCQINDNLHGAVFPSIVAAAQRARLPIFSFSTGQVAQGAAVVLSNDHVDGGRESGLIAAQVMRGATPAQFPYRGITRTRLLVNRRAAEAAGLRIPEAVLGRAEK